MLKAHQVCIDLNKGVLRIQDREVSFLAEHELPERAHVDELSEALEAAAAGASAFKKPGGGLPDPGQKAGPSTTAGSSRPRNPSRPASNNQYPESAIQTIMDLGGVSREVAISTLDAAGGNVDVAASLLF
jgi:DNA damage-inducible protein 1